MERKKLKREIEREALTRLEDSARTEAEFRAVVKEWNRLDGNKYRRWGRHEFGRPNFELLHWDKENESAEVGALKKSLDTVIPAPLEHAFWRQLLAGDFLDVIFDCPHEMHEQTSSASISEVLQTLNENQREVLYYWAIRQETPQQIARRRGQTDRNILKVYDTLIAGLRRNLFEQLSSRYFEGKPLTLQKKQFVEDYLAGKFSKKKTKKKTAVDSGGSK